MFDALMELSVSACDPCHRLQYHWDFQLLKLSWLITYIRHFVYINSLHIRLLINSYWYLILLIQNIYICIYIYIAVSLRRFYAYVNTLRPRQIGRRFAADDAFKCIFLNENSWILIKCSLKFVPRGTIIYIPALAQVMAWRLSCDKPLSEPMMVTDAYMRHAASMSWSRKCYYYFRPMDTNRIYVVSFIRLVQPLCNARYVWHLPCYILLSKYPVIHIASYDATHITAALSIFAIQAQLWHT